MASGILRRGVGELSGALGDLGTLLPLLLGAVAVAGLAPAPVLAGFGAFYLATALVYRLPVPVQPMKAIAAVLMTGAVSPAALAASGVMIGAVLLLLALSGAIGRLGRLVPQSVLAGLQLGLGLSLGLVALRLMAGQPAVAAVTLAAMAPMLWRPGVPGALLAVAAAVAAGQALGQGQAAVAAAPAALPGWPDAAELGFAATGLALPQLALTLTNAVLLTALVAGDCFGPRAAHVTPRRLALTSGLANLLLCPLGALPMCHGAGGLAAHHRFGARSGAAPALLGLGCLALAAAPAGVAAAVLGAVPAAGLGALLLVAAAQLALGRRLIDSRPACWPAIALAAAVTLWFDPFLGLVAGTAVETLRAALAPARRSRRRSQNG